MRGYMLCDFGTTVGVPENLDCLAVIESFTFRNRQKFVRSQRRDPILHGGIIR